jgi:hypothetical protein
MKRQGMDLFKTRKYVEAARLLQLAEIFFRPIYPVHQSQKHHWHECWKYVIAASWHGKMYLKAIQAGKKWQRLEPIASQVCEIYITVLDPITSEQSVFDYDLQHVTN